MNKFYLSSRSLGRLVGVDEELIGIPKLAIKLTDIDFGIPEYGGFRSAEDQRDLYIKGASPADGIHNVSKHQSGRAFDYYAIDPETGKSSWDKGLMAQVACAQFQAASRLGINIEWGGLWVRIDMPHIELTGEK